MRNTEVIKKRNELNQLRQVMDKDAYRKFRNEYKKTLRESKKNFVKKSLSSKDSKELCQTIHKILKPQHRRIPQDPDELNEYYANLAATITNKPNEPIDQTLINNLLPTTEAEEVFRIKHTNYHEVRKIINGLRNDCYSGFDRIPVKFIKSASDHIISPLVHIINSSIDHEQFPDKWKIGRCLLYTSPSPRDRG